MSVGIRLVATVGRMMLGVAAAVVALELLFRLLPVSTSSATGYYVDPMIIGYPAGHRFTTSTGWSLQNARHQRANDAGFLADHDFVPNPEAVALIGDSFVEASMLAPDERLAAQIERRLYGRPVYALGSPGSALLDYAERIRFAAERYGIHDFVLLLEHGDLAQALCGSGNVVARCLDPGSLEPRVETQAPPSTLKRVLRQSALAQYLFSQLKLDPAIWVRGLLDRAPPAPADGAPRDPAAISPAALDRVLAEFYARVEPWHARRLIFIVTGDARPGSTARDIPPETLGPFVEAARRHGAIVVETAPQLREYAQRSGLSMHVSPRDAHYNRLALGMFADAVAPLLGDAAE